MSESMVNKVDLIKFYIQKGEIDKAKEEAESVIQEDPESPKGYLLMAYHYYLLEQREETLYWIEEMLQRAPEDEAVLEMAIKMYPSLPADEPKLKELIELGLRLYPENHFFHAAYADIIWTSDVEQTLASLQEAIRLKPEDDNYLGAYASLLYTMLNYIEAEKYEQLALQANPENIRNIVRFAWFAYQRKKYKKAQLLIDEAMRLEPNNPSVREYYKKIYPTKNLFIRAKKEIDDVLLKAMAYPAYYLEKLLKGRVDQGNLNILVLLIELFGIIALLRWNSLILFGAYFLLLFTSLKISKSMLKKVGFTNAEETALQKKAKSTQKAALKEMKLEVAKQKKQPIPEQTALSPHELEAKLSEIWNSTNIADIREKTVVEAETEVKIEASVPKDSTAQSNQALNKELQTTKEYSKWPVYMMTTGIVLSSLFKLIPDAGDINPPKPVSVEIQESIDEAQDEIALEEDTAMIKENAQVVSQFMESIKAGNLSSTMPQLVSDKYQTMIQANINHPLLNQTANAKIEKVINPNMGLAVSYFLLVNEAENVNIIVKVAYGQITYLYAQNWNQSQEDTEVYQKMLNQLELAGEDVQKLLQE